VFADGKVAVMTTKRTIENADLVLPHLVHCAQTRKTITYGELAAKIDRHHRAIPHSLGHIRHKFLKPKGLPFLTAIVVNQETRLPGDSWWQDCAQNLTLDERRQKHREVCERVFVYDEWDTLLQELELSPIPRTDDDLDAEGLARTIDLERKGQVGEREPHRMLKKYVARNPTAIGLQARKAGKKEYRFVSGDKCDVVFDLEQNGHAVVEIKGGERGELVRGIYQAIKYRALMVAEKGHGQDYPVSAYLVAYDIPDDIATFAGKFQIQCCSIPRSVASA
jgi:hypothetical protein